MFARHRTRITAVAVFCLVCSLLVPPGANAMTVQSLPTPIRRVTARTQRQSGRLMARRAAATTVLSSRVTVRTIRGPVQETVQKVTDTVKEKIQEIPAIVERVLPKRPSYPVPADPVKEEVLRLVNQERAARGLGALTREGVLEKTAQEYAEDMNTRNFFGHTDPDGRASFVRIRNAGYLIAPCDCAWTYRTGENLAKGQRTPAEVVQDWMNSPSHRENILREDFSETGFGIRNGYWVEHFGSVAAQ